jgi:hypothetical protein
MSRNNLFGPWGNPHIEEGLYEAAIQSICHTQNREGEGSMLHLTFQLEPTGLAFSSRLYLPKEFSSGCQRRMWYLCQAIGLEGCELMEDPDLAVGRRLVLDVTTIHPTTANHGQPYRDVKRFLPFAVKQDVEDFGENTTW